MNGEPEDVSGECNARMYIGDNFKDNHDEGSPAACYAVNAAIVIRALREQVAEHEALQDLQRNAADRAAELWREKTGEELCIPDRAEAIVFLAEENERLREQVAELTREAEAWQMVKDFYKFNEQEESWGVSIDPEFGERWKQARDHAAGADARDDAASAAEWKL